MGGKRKGITSSPLTARELEILKWIKEGKTSWEIGKILGISERTVNYHVSDITRKLNAMNRNHAVAIAVSHGLVEF
jgi:DNA-binding CsgD family transcriptional regulator